MSIYAIITLVLVGISFGIVLVKHGKPHEDYNIWTWLIAVAIQTFLMYMGGFFDKVK